MKIYSTRHGQTDYNLKDMIQGTTDNELNDTGIAQAYELAEKVSQKADIDFIISLYALLFRIIHMGISILQHIQITIFIIIFKIISIILVNYKNIY